MSKSTDFGPIAKSLLAKKEKKLLQAVDTSSASYAEYHLKELEARFREMTPFEQRKWAQVRRLLSASLSFAHDWSTTPTVSKIFHDHFAVQFHVAVTDAMFAALATGGLSQWVAMAKLLRCDLLHVSKVWERCMFEPRCIGMALKHFPVTAPSFHYFSPDFQIEPNSSHSQNTTSYDKP